MVAGCVMGREVMLHEQKSECVIGVVGAVRFVAVLDDVVMMLRDDVVGVLGGETGWDVDY